MTKWLKCWISPGQFSDEYAVSGTLFDNTEFSLFAETDDLGFNGEPTQEDPVEGWIRIDSELRKDDLALVALPKPTLENGRLITVSLKQMR